MLKTAILLIFAICVAVGAPAQIIQAQATPVASSAADICATNEDGATPVANVEKASTPVEIDLASLEFDLLFIDAMIPQHELAIELAVVARDQTDRLEITQMADNIIETKQDEINSMSQWRTEWYQNIPSLSEQQLIEAMSIKLSVNPGVGGVAGLGTTSTEGMRADVRELCTTSEDVDLVFIDLMVKHHAAAVVLAMAGVSQGVHPAIRELAARNVQDQQAEIDQLLVWRDQWFPGVPIPDRRDG